MISMQLPELTMSLTDHAISLAGVLVPGGLTLWGMRRADARAHTRRDEVRAKRDQAIEDRLTHGFSSMTDRLDEAFDKMHEHEISDAATFTRLDATLTGVDKTLSRLSDSHDRQDVLLREMSAREWARAERKAEASER